MPDQIIIYRNPLEAAMWDAIMNNAGQFFAWWFGFMIIVGGGLVIGMMIAGWYRNRKWNRKRRF